MNAPVKIVCLLAFAWLVVPDAAIAAPSTVDTVSGQVLMVHDDVGNWGGSSTGMTHQSAPGYEAKKVLDLADVPEEVWRSVTQVRLSARFCVRDYSKNTTAKVNGLDEAFEIVVNGHVHRVPTDSPGLPLYADGVSLGTSLRWHDFPIPKAELIRGPNEFVFRKVVPEGKKADDYLYLGIDNTVPGGNSSVRFSDSSPWRQDRLTAPGGTGEYMVRVYLIHGPRGVEARWRPAEHKVDDPRGAIQYAGSEGPTTRVEWDPARIDRLEPLTVTIETSDERPISFRWLDAQGQPTGPAVTGAGPRLKAVRPAPQKETPAGIELPKATPLVSITLRATAGYHPVPEPVDIAPRMWPPQGALAQRQPSCKVAEATEDGKQPQTIELANDNLRCRFEVRDGRLRLASLFNEPAAAEMIREPDECRLLLVEVDGKRYAGSQDFVVRDVAETADRVGFTATLECKPAGLEAVLSVRIDDALRMGLAVTNRGDGPTDFKVAFPHLAGLAVSPDPADDYYFYPYGGGIISDRPALIRAAYGDHEALYQVVDLFGPTRGAGLAVWCTDDDGRYKGISLRKHAPGRQEVNADVTRPPTSEEYIWTNSLQQTPGIGLAYEYLRRTRGPGESFAAKEVALWAHAGDWHAAMRRYADWCHRMWNYRGPWQGKPVVNMIAVGWGKSPVFRKGQYRTDYLRPETDCVELMSWWEWSTAGPGGFPIDQLANKLGEAKATRWQSYLVEDPVTGKVAFSNNPGDYDGYNQRWGGLEAFREAVRMYQDRGAMVTLYTDPFRVDRASKCGQKYGELWGVVKPDGSYRDDYDAWRMCHDVAGYREWVAQTMARVLRETGVDGIRLDEYGHRGSACFSKRHKHTFAEPGCTEWQRGVAEATRLVRRAMDEVNPHSILTTEHPGYDFLMPAIDGCITYDLTVLSSPLRPLECNTQRFYFPECRAFELDHRKADPRHVKRFWNGVGSFGSYYPAPMYRVLEENADALWGEGATADPLVPTLAPRVYANCFEREGKTLYTIYNATGHTFAGAAIAVEVGRGEHVFDLLAGRDAVSTVGAGGATVTLFLPRDDVACLAVMPKKLAVRRTAGRIEVGVAGDVPPAAAVCLAAADGEVLARQSVENRQAVFDLAGLGETAARAVYVKLLVDERLVDALQLPSPADGSGKLP